MNTKDKLEIAWKYLALILVAVIAFNWTKTSSSNSSPNRGEFVFIGNEDENFLDKEMKQMKVDVEKEVVNGDTTMRVVVNGKPIDIADFQESNGEMKWTGDDGEIHIIKMKKDNSNNNYEIIEENEDENGANKIIKRKIIKTKVNKF